MSTPVTALLTTGAGPLAVAAYRALSRHSDLRVVVFSRRTRRPVPLLARVRDYGAWYLAQHASAALARRVTGSRLQLPAGAATGVATGAWQGPGDEPRVRDMLLRAGVEMAWVCQFQHRITATLLDAVPGVNIHPSLLPDYRGPEPVAWGLLDGAASFGVTVHRVDQGIDTGGILAQVRVPRPAVPWVFAVERALAGVLEGAVCAVLEGWRRGERDGRPQSGGFYRSAPTLANRRAARG